MLDTPLVSSQEIAQRLRSSDRRGHEQTAVVDRTGASSYGTLIFSQRAAPAVTLDITGTLAEAREQPARPEQRSADEQAVASARDARLQLVALKYEGRASTEDMARLHILTLRLRKLAPRVDAEALSNLEQAVGSIERVAENLAEIDRELDAL